MKKLLLITILLITSNMFAQIDINTIIPEFTSPANYATPQEHSTLCLTDQSNSPYLSELETIRGLDHTEDIFNIKIYVHTLSKEQEPYYGFTIEAVNRILQTLYDDFDPLGIHFVWDGYIDNIRDDDLAFPGLNGGNIGTIFNTNNHTDGIDIYLADELLSGSNWHVANGVGSSTELYIGGFSMVWEVIPMSWLKYISHTMGHVLFLYDTQWGTSIHEPYNCPEKADGTNGDACGDYIFDTPADPGLYYFNVDVNTCEFDPQYYNIPAIDPLTNLPYQPDTGNIMSLTNPQCYSNNNGFTYQQKQRMKNAIWYIPALHSTLLDNYTYIRAETDCYTCYGNYGHRFYKVYSSKDLSHLYPISSPNVFAEIDEQTNDYLRIKVSSLLGPTEGEQGDFSIVNSGKGIIVANQTIWVGNPETVADDQLMGTEYIAQAGDGAGHVLDNNVWLKGTDYYHWEFPEPYEPIPLYNPNTDPTIWQYSKYAEHFFFANTPSSGEETGFVRTYGLNPCGHGSTGLYNELCVENADDPQGDLCNPAIVYYPNPADSLLSIDLSLQEYDIFTVTVYDDNQIAVYTDQSENVVKTVDTFNLSNGTYYLHIYDSSDELILSRILIINHY